MLLLIFLLLFLLPITYYMSPLTKKLLIKRSSLPKAGKGLFTKAFIPKAARIVEYTGEIKTWKEITSNPDFNAYVFYINKNYVIDSKNIIDTPARYINDAKGLNNIEGFRNNCKFEVDGLKAYVVATANIDAGAELFIDYGKEYWEAIRYNQSL